MKRGKLYRRKRLILFVRAAVLVLSAVAVIIIGYYTAAFFSGSI